MEITPKELKIIGEALYDEVKTINDSFKKRGIPFCIAYSMLTNSGDNWVASAAWYVAPKGGQIEKLHHEISTSIALSMENKEE